MIWGLSNSGIRESGNAKMKLCVLRGIVVNLAVNGHTAFFRLVLVFFPQLLFSQDAYRLNIIPVDQTEAFLQEQLDLPEEFTDSLSVLTAIEDIRNQLRQKSYLGLSVDSMAWKDKQATIWLYVGPLWRLNRIYPADPDDPIWEKARIRWKNLRDKELVLKEIEWVREAALSAAENNGYPFAQVRLDSLEISGNRVEAALVIDKGPLLVWKDVLPLGDAKIKNSFLRAYLGIKAGEPYSREKFLQVSKRLRELSYLQLAEEPSILFSGREATLNLNLKKRRASRFDFLIGVLPNSSQNGRLIITGDFEGEFVNSFGLGERLYAQFEQLRPQTQQLHLAANVPYLLELPLGVDVDFQLYKRDTTFLDLDATLGIQWLFEGGSNLSTFWNLRSSSLLSLDTDRLNELQNLPDTLDYRTNSFGIAYTADQLDYRFNPRQGWRVHLRSGAGLKQVRRNSRILESDLAPQYDSIPLRAVQFRLEGQGAYFIPVFRRSTLMAGFKGGSLISDNPVYANEQFRIGGTKVLRGFDEQQFFVTHYAVGTLEYRLLIDTNSYIFTFFDGGWISSVTTQTNRRDTPIGFGAGLALDTKAGIFGLSLAYGKQENLPLNFGAPKLHVGYVSRF